MKNVITLALFIFAAVACKDPLVEQILAIHNQTMELEKETALKMDQLIQFRNGINVQGRALSEDELIVVGEIDAIEQRWLDWQKTFLPVNAGSIAKADREAVLQEQQLLLETLQALRAAVEQMLEAPF